MKRVKLYKVTAALAALLLLAGCEWILGPDRPEDTGNLVIVLGTGGGERASFPSAEAQAALRYDLVLSGPQEQVIKVSLSAGDTYSGHVALGDWQIYIEAFTPEGMLIGTGSTGVTVVAGLNEARVIMRVVPDIPVDDLNLTGKVTAPVKGATPNVASIDTTQYTGTIEWKKGDDSSFSGNFAAATEYKAIVALTAKPGYIFTGLGSSSFTYTGAASINNAVQNSTATIVTIVFPLTASPPTNVTSLTATAGNGAVTLTWTDPADADLDHIKITWSAGSGGNETVAKGTQTYTATGLTNGTPYTFTVKAVDTVGNESSGETSASRTPLAPTGVITVQFTGLEDEEITLSSVDTPLSWAADTALVVTVSGTYTTYRWSLDGTTLEGETNASLTLRAGSLAVKQHILTVFVTKDGVEYTKRVTFTVAQ